LGYWSEPRCCRFWWWPRRERGADIPSDLGQASNASQHQNRRNPPGASQKGRLAASLARCSPLKGMRLSRSLPSAPSDFYAWPTPVSKQSPNPRSIASQLILLFTLAAALLLACGLGVFYWVVVRHAFAEDNAVLADKVDALQTSFEQRGGLDAVAAEINTAGSRQRAPFLVRVLDPAGTTIGQTTGMERLLPANIFPPVASREIAAPAERRVAGKSFALTTRRAFADGQQFTIQVAQDRSSDEQVERKFGILVLVVLSGSILASILIAIPVTRRGLRPLEEMKRSLERIGPTHLNERVASANWPRELQPMAFAFDEMLKRLDDSFTRLSQFSADLAHELRTPIANMLGEAQVALSRDRNCAEYRETIESTIGECERLSGIVDNLLFVARADAAREPVERKQFDARPAVEKIAAFYETIAEDRHVAINCSGQGQISADPALFERAVGNLVDNALRFTPENGSIQIALSEHAKDFEVAVSDNGSGIAPEHLPRVFDRFYRAESSRGSDGAGLGLALVKSIVDLHGGTARIQSEMGRGTIVSLTFPKGAQPPTAQPAPAS
jgi:two-component system, OmpR family, heavy metal sensor histidine kinase CusS